MLSPFTSATFSIRLLRLGPALAASAALLTGLSATGCVNDRTMPNNESLGSATFFDNTHAKHGDLTFLRMEKTGKIVVHGELSALAVSTIHEVAVFPQGRCDELNDPALASAGDRALAEPLLRAGTFQSDASGAAKVEITIAGDAAAQITEQCAVITAADGSVVSHGRMYITGYFPAH